MALIVAAMLVFALLHSLTADARLKAWVRTRIGVRAYEGLYRPFYNVLSVVILAPIMLALVPGGTVLYTLPAALAPVLLVLQIIGGVGALVSLLQIDLWRFVGLAQIWAYVTHKSLPLADEPLKVTGVYGWVRHPLYFFSLLSLWSVSPMTDHYLAFVVMATLYFIIGSRMEEKRLQRAYGVVYTEYQAQVPWLLPRLTLFGRKA